MSEAPKHGTCSFMPCGRPRENGLRLFCQTHNRMDKNNEPLRPIQTKYNKPTDGLCTFQGCGRRWRAAMWCRAHYEQSKAGKDLTPIGQKRDSITCVGPKCDRPTTSYDLCDEHRRQKSDGKDLTPILFKTTYRLPRKQAWVRDAEGGKQCLQCEEWQPTYYFQKRSQAKDGLQSRCYKCLAEARAQWISKDAILRRQYGIGEAEYDEMLQRQDGACAGCKRNPETMGTVYLSVDHDHACCPGKGKSGGCCVRGLLCAACNGALGLVADNVDTMKNLIAYLETSGL